MPYGPNRPVGLGPIGRWWLTTPRSRELNHRLIPVDTLLGFACGADLG